MPDYAKIHQIAFQFSKIFQGDIPEPPAAGGSAPTPTDREGENGERTTGTRGRTGRGGEGKEGERKAGRGKRRQGGEGGRRAEGRAEWGG
jgi:hypothetical protein